jgi:hypothetical protein
MTDPLRNTRNKRLVALINLSTIFVFSIVWGLEMYLSFRGSTFPIPTAGKVYPVTIHGTVVYVTLWQSYVCSSYSTTTMFLLIVLFVLLNRPFKSF